jgi:hypothetical protein
MLRRLSGLLMRLANLWTLLLATALYVFFIATVMPDQSAASTGYAGSWGSPDRHFFYTPDELYAQVATWGAGGRADYVEFRLGLDIVWAFAYTAFLVAALGCACRAAFAAGSLRRLLNLSPLPAMLCDYAENAVGIYLVASFPARHDGLAWAATFITAGKWLTLALAHAILIYALAAAIWARWRLRGGRSAPDQ